MGKKDCLNSKLYGAVGNQYFRYYDVRQASGITTAGQFIIRFIEKKVNEYLNGVLQTKGEIDYIVALIQIRFMFVLINLWQKLVMVKQLNKKLTS